jgi:hypothetical protein
MESDSKAVIRVAHPVQTSAGSGARNVRFAR